MFSGWIGGLQYSFHGSMVREDSDIMPIEVWDEMSDGPHNCKRFQLRDRVVSLSWCQGTAGVSHWMR